MEKKWAELRAALGGLARVALRQGHAALGALEDAVEGPAREAVREAVIAAGGAVPTAPGMPREGISKTEILARLDAYKSFDVAWRDGRTWAYVYDAGGDAGEVCKQAYSMFLSENGLDPTAFPSVVQLENEVVGMVGGIVGLPAGGAGSFTSGGTESIFLAVKAARDHARATRKVGNPRILLPHTAHASFHKAAHYLGLRVDLVPVDLKTFKADVEVMRAAIRPETVMMVGSACSYAHGVVDPIPELGALAEETGVWLHVDACIGGFVLHYFGRLGVKVTPWDFSVPGVSSLSVDPHKYGFTAKGASLVLYRERALREYQYYACSRWSGYTVVNTTVQSSKSAGPVAGAWAVLKHFGDEGYLELFRGMLDSTRRVADAIRAHPRLRLLAEPESNLVAFTSDEVNVFHVADEMRQRGWFVQPQLAFEATKENIHLSVNPKAGRWIDRFLVDLDESVDAAAKLPSGELAGQVEEKFGELGQAPLTQAQFRELLAFAGIDGAMVPDRMAAVNEILNTLPPRTREELLVKFLNEVFATPA